MSVPDNLPTARVAAELPAALRTELEAAAKQHGVPMSSVVRWALVHWLACPQATTERVA